MRLCILAFISLPSWCFAQPNCNVYKFDNDEPCYQACLLATEGEKYQGLKRSQILFDEAIALCPSLDYAYFEKAVPYLKRGDFITWKQLIDKAVSLNETGHLGYRGWCRYQFLRDYHGAIKDIEKLDSLVSHDIGYSQNGDYHLNVAKALCYKAIGKKEKAIAIIENQLSQQNYTPMPFDYLHLGVLMVETGDSKGAIQYLQKQIAYNDFMAETYYFLGLAYKQLKLQTDYQENMKKAHAYYLKDYKLSDPYTHPMNKIYLTDIERELIHK